MFVVIFFSLSFSLANTQKINKTDFPLNLFGSQILHGNKLFSQVIYSISLSCVFKIFYMKTTLNVWTPFCALKAYDALYLEDKEEGRESEREKN
jgi:hypothetical protein